MLKHFHRHRMPTDGTWVRTEAGLNGIVRDINRWGGDRFREEDDPDYRPLHTKLEGVWVPVWVKLEPHKGQATPQNPEATYYHPIVKIGNVKSTQEIKLSSCYAAGLGQDCGLDSYNNFNMWHYRPLDDYYMANALVPPGEDTSQYECSICQKVLYRDESGRRYDRSATIYDGSLVCRDCEVDGAVFAQDVEDRLAKVRKVCDHIAKNYHTEAVAAFKHQWDFLSRKTAWDKPNQTRVWLDGEWSFYWRDFHLVEPGKKQRAA